MNLASGVVIARLPCGKAIELPASKSLLAIRVMPPPPPPAPEPEPLRPPRPAHILKADRPTILWCIEATAYYSGVPVKEIVGDGKPQRIADTRHCAIWLARRFNRSSFPVLGKYFLRHHTSCVHAYYRVKERLDGAFIPADPVQALSLALAQFQQYARREA